MKKTKKEKKKPSWTERKSEKRKSLVVQDEKWRQETIKNTSEIQFNQEFLCEFLGSTRTLIDASKLRSMVFKKPILSTNGIDVYEEPIKKATYCMIVDTAQGKGQDYSAFSVFDVSQIPYRQVAKYRSKYYIPSRNEI